MLEHGGKLNRAAQHYGIAREHWLDLSTGINPHTYPVPTTPAEAWARLPEDDDGLMLAAAAYYGTPHLLPVAGTQAAIQALPALRSSCRVAVLSPAYAEHAHAWRQAGHAVRELAAAHIAAALPDVDVLVLIQPNNPSGVSFDRMLLLQWHASLAEKGGWLVVDEAFIEATSLASVRQQSMPQGLIVLRGMGKFFGLAGARVGFVAAHPELLDKLRNHLGPWPISGAARIAASTALRDLAWQTAMRARLQREGTRLTQLLTDAGWPPCGGCGLFQWVQTEQAHTLHQHLARQGILTRLFDAPPSLRFGLPSDEASWQRLRDALATRSGTARANPGKARIDSLPLSGGRSSTTLMVQGTTSNAGKSTLVTALCRWLVRQGVAVAPFKPQNMALNSAVTADGGEIGRAQAVQAQAAKLSPHTDMNPVLLKPNSDTGAQVIIQGRAISNMEAAAYHDYKKVAMNAVLESHQRLCAQYQCIVVEGAGSPAEINLRAGDIANMGFAEAVDCKVVLIADIDRGGVFAHLVGTLELLTASEQARVVGFVINRFRGDLSLLQGGLDWLEQRTGKPVLGVLPYLHGLHLEAEDALPLFSLSCGHCVETGDARKGHVRGCTAASCQQHTPKLRVIVPVLPHISNHTDFDPLRLHPQIDFAFVPITESLPPADLIILPGSKNVRGDLKSLRQAGWEAALHQHLRYGGKLIGICGGLQMLGEFIHDPLGLEGDAGSSVGLNLLQLSTTLQGDKQLRNVSGTLSFDSAQVAGYEIHAGISVGAALARPALHLEHGNDGAISADGKIFATYLHGLFESAQATDALLRWAGLNEVHTPDYHARREADIERLANSIAQHLDTARLRQLCGLEAT